MFMRVASLCVLVGLAVIAAGCGQKGPLVLPDAQHPRKKAKLPAQHSTPAPPPAAPTPAPPTPAPAAPSGSTPTTAPPEAAPETSGTPNAAPRH